MTYIRHNRTIRKDRVIVDDKRWMIRGIGREIRKAVKDAAKTEGISVGTWVRRSIVQGLDATANGPTTLVELGKHVRVIAARLSVLEKSHRELHHEVHAADTLTSVSTTEKRRKWRTKKSK